MSIKVRSAILFTSIISLILGASFIFIYYSYKDFKEDEFFLRLEQKALTTYKFLTEVKEIDYDLLKVIDRNTINELYQEKVLIFNDSLQLIYSSIDDQAIEYSTDLLKEIKQQRKITNHLNSQELVGIYVNHNNSKGIVIASATDKHGEKKLSNLKFILIAVYLTALLVTALLAYFFVKQSFKPIEILTKQISNINQHQLGERLPENKSNDEINLLAKNFNQMLSRIENAFKVQRSFIQHASHELRTPLANLITSCELALSKQLTNQQYAELIKSFNEEHHHLIEVTNALLMLSQYENKSYRKDDTETRVDEIIFETVDEIQKDYPAHKIKFMIEDSLTENQLTLNINPILLKTAITNLVRNACKYGKSNEVEIALNYNLTSGLNVDFKNDGTTLSDEEVQMIMQPFYRGLNTNGQKGYGLGLSITNRIIELYNGSLTYHKRNDNNIFKLSFHNI
jgi:signal transduction histidine kinase